MNLRSYLKTHEGSLIENNLNRIITLVLLIALVLMTVKAFRKETVVTVQPYTLQGEAWVSHNKASQSYKEAWAMLIAQLTGNVTPGSVGFVKERIEPLLSPEIFASVMEAIEVQSAQIRDDRVSMRFEPRTVEYELSTDIVYVYGNSYIQGPSSEPVRTDRTYEYIIDIRDFAPVVTHIETYTGRPRTERVREQMERQEERRRERENNV